MLKKVAFVLALMLLVSFVLSAESGPSNTVGFTKIAYNATYQNAFGVAFKTWDVAGGVPVYGTPSTKPSDVVGNQMGGNGTFTGDRITQQSGTGYFAYHTTAAPYWAGSLETNGGMGGSMALWAQEKQGVAGSLVIAGQVDTAGYADSINISPNYQNPLTYQEAREVNRSDLNLLTCGFSQGTQFTSDRLTEQTGLGRFCYNTAGTSATWAGSMVTTTPAMTYWWQEKHGHTHKYKYVSMGDKAAPPERPGGRDAGMDRVNQPVRPSRSVR